MYVLSNLIEFFYLHTKWSIFIDNIWVMSFVTWSLPQAIGMGHRSRVLELCIAIVSQTANQSTFQSNGFVQNGPLVRMLSSYTQTRVFVPKNTPPCNLIPKSQANILGDEKSTCSKKKIIRSETITFSRICGYSILFWRNYKLYRIKRNIRAEKCITEG